MTIGHLAKNPFLRRMVILFYTIPMVYTIHGCDVSLCFDLLMAERSRAHNDANIIPNEELAWSINF